jgi:hypothetical protein
MPRTARAPVLTPGLATGIGSLPYADARAAADVVLRHHPRLPAVPQLPASSPLEGMIPQWARALPEVEVCDDGSIVVIGAGSYEPPVTAFDDRAHGGLLAFLARAAADAPPQRVKVQVAGPLTLGMALHRAGMPIDRAFRRGGEVARQWAAAVEELVATNLPGTGLVLFFDEPALVTWRRHEGPIDREVATDLLSGALAAAGCATGVHVCGEGDRRLALEAGPRILGVEVHPGLADDADVIARHLDADGWIAWGAIPTDRPVGESVEPHWRALTDVWCELTRRGCDPARLRTQGLITPACGLAGHGPSQAELALRLARAVADRVHDQAVAARLTLGA